MDERIRKLAAEKSNFQIVIQLINKVAAVTGLDKSVDTILRSIGEVIGGNNISLYYWIDDTIHFADAFGGRKEVRTVDDRLIQNAMAMGQPIEVNHKESGKDLEGNNYMPEYTWVVPLKIGATLVGVLKVERLNLGMREFSRQLTPFFHFVALSLNNEISSQTRLKKANDSLAEEVKVRKVAEAALSRANASLESRVSERTAELLRSNELLKEKEQQQTELLARMLGSRQALLSILEDRKVMEAQLQRSEEQFRALFENSPVGLWLEDFSGVKARLEALRSEGVQDLERYLLENPDEVRRLAASIRVILMNRVSVALLGVKDEAELERELPAFFDEATWPVFIQELLAIAHGETSFTGEMTVHNMSGEELSLVLKMVVPPGYEDSLERVIISLLDISEHQKAEQKIKVLLNEKELLLREVHHRIKNNMATITSLLNMQIDAQKDPSARLALLDAAGRVQSMMVLYDKLYRSGDFGSISLQAYVSDLIADVVDLFPSRAWVQVFVDIVDIALPAQILAPLGIIINELITNSMKYAFPEPRPEGVGRILFSAVQADGKCRIVYEDNGIGLPANFSLKQSTGFGMQLVSVLVEQIEASIRVEAGSGAKFVIEFKV